MKLLRLEVHGFKSFKDKTTIHFDEGITGIVGPNGCGKSNIVDALFWVMGEQSAKHLRGNKMKDLIFAGSSKYSPATWAEVTLVLLNDNGKHIHIGNQVVKPQEIALTRKLYRNGETEYRINGTPARLKDIQEVFMDTGAGAKSYSIIAQGEINRLVQAKPEERRTMIEEVAGITKFKLRKRESLKKIEHTQTNLNRLEDLKTEIYKNLKALENQAEKAERARSLKEKIKKHELVVMSHQEFDYLNDYLTAKNALESKSTLLDEFQIRKNQIELNLEDERIKKDDLISKIDELQADYNEMARELAKSEERLKHLKTSRADKEKHIETKTRENEEVMSDIESRSAKKEELSIKLDDLENNNVEDLDFSSMEEKVENLKEALSDKEESIRDLQSKLDEVREDFQQIDQQAFKNTSKLEEYAANLEDITAEIDDIEKSTTNFSDELIAQRDSLANYKTKLADLEELKTNIKEELDAKAADLKATDVLLRDLSKEVIQIESKRQSLIEINKSGEGVKEGGLNFLEATSDTSFEILGHVIECRAEYAKGIEALFENTFDALISKGNDNKSLTNWWQNNQDISFDFVIPQEMARCGEETIERLKLKGLNGLIPAEELIKVNDPEFQKVLNNFFNGYYIAENLNAESALNIPAEIRFKGIASVDGSIILNKTANGMKLSVRSQDDSTLGVVQRNNLINELTVSFETKSEELRKLEEKETTLDQEVESLRARYGQVRTDFDEANYAFISLKSSLESKEDAFGASSSRLDILKKRKTEISKHRLELLESEEELLTKRDSLAEQIEELSSLLEEERERIDELRMSYEEERSSLLEMQAHAKTYQSQLDNIKSQIEDVNSQVERYKEKYEKNLELLEAYHNEIEQAQTTVETLTAENSNVAETLSEKDSYLSLVKDELSQLLIGMQDRESEVKDLTSNINKIEKENVENEMKIEKVLADEEILVKDCFDKHRVDLRDCISRFLEVFPEALSDLADVSAMFEMETEEGPTTLRAEAYLFDKKFPAVVRESKEKYKRYKSDLNRLGEINWKAIEDYERQKIRYDFLKDQEVELKKSLEDLETAIAHIDEKSRVRFKEAYTEVNDRFTKVFPIIFGGGEAKLEIVGDLDSAECGIDIIAKPPGKKMQSINLMSGGEKAMTAVSLIFSIFLVKPSPFCLLDEVDAPLDDANVGRFNELLREMSSESQFILITHNKKTMELNDMLYGVTMQEPGVSKAVSVQLH